jgi:hypothetical protein
MKNNSLEAKLELYYDKLQHPDKIIDNWAIVDTEAYSKLNKTTLTNINEVNQYLTERIITTETKNKYIIIKYSSNFIATKVIETEYDHELKDWDLVGIDRDHLYTGKLSKVMTNKEIIKLLGFKLTAKAKKDLEYFS